MCRAGALKGAPLCPSPCSATAPAPLVLPTTATTSRLATSRLGRYWEAVQDAANDEAWAAAEAEAHDGDTYDPDEEFDDAEAEYDYGFEER
ncbi:hypothetical protein [Streptomyces sp. NPDC054865]